MKYVQLKLKDGDHKILKVKAIQAGKTIPRYIEDKTFSENKNFDEKTIYKLMSEVEDAHRRYAKLEKKFLDYKRSQKEDKDVHGESLVDILSCIEYPNLLYQTIKKLPEGSLDFQDVTLEQAERFGKNLADAIEGRSKQPPEVSKEEEVTMTEAIHIRDKIISTAKKHKEKKEYGYSKKKSMK